MRMLKSLFLKSCGIFIPCMIALMLVGCKSTQPMTQKVDELASRVGKIKNFQYYVSRNIVLTKTEDPDIVGRVNVDGKLKVTLNKDYVQITSATAGALLNTTTDEDGYKVYHVAFEEDNDNCLRFVQKSRDRESNIYLLYDDPQNHAVLYGGDVYIVTWDGLEGMNSSKAKAKFDNWSSKMKGALKGVTNDENDEPYLLVKMNVKVKEKEEYRKASGRKVQVTE